ncbi:hypothetical protein [Jeotgalibacillus aurantiacus]|uniref:hypothetical protein n=1 Tax=Jeotgalibacillus aurantiacus TaxID=2763266 RepID=UPI001D0BE2FB|nr:hypothetical protein [Jeotgalibacillus aurantiacus]
MEAKVLRIFRDGKGGEVYPKNSVYKSEDKERFEYLQKEGFLEKEEASSDGGKDEAEFPKHTGGGYFELSDGTKVQGKDAAVKEQEKLDKAGE